MGRCQVEQPLLGKVGIRPALMVRTPSFPTAASSLAEYTPQAHAYPAVEVRKSRAVAVLKILKPAPQRTVDIGNDHVQAAACRASCFRPYRVLELCQALSAREASMLHKPVAQKVKFIDFGIHDFGFRGM
jgi:hypothetical protein